MDDLDIEPTEPIVEPLPGTAPPSDIKPIPKMIPIERLNQVNERLKVYKDIGSPDDIRREREEYRTWKDREEQIRLEKEKGDPEHIRQERIKEEFYNLFPEHRDLPKTMAEMRKMMEEERTIRQTTSLKLASEHLSGLLQKEGFGRDNAFQGEIEDYLLSKMTEDELAQFVRGDIKIMEKHYNTSLKSGLIARLKSASTKPQERVFPIRHTPGGTQSKPENKAKTMQEAEDAAYARITAKE